MNLLDITILCKTKRLVDRKSLSRFVNKHIFYQKKSLRKDVLIWQLSVLAWLWKCWPWFSREIWKPKKTLVLIWQLESSFLYKHKMDQCVYVPKPVGNSICPDPDILLVLSTLSPYLRAYRVAKAIWSCLRNQEILVKRLLKKSLILI